MDIFHCGFYNSHNNILVIGQNPAAMCPAWFEWQGVSVSGKKVYLISLGKQINNPVFEPWLDQFQTKACNFFSDRIFSWTNQFIAISLSGCLDVLCCLVNMSRRMDGTQ